MTLTDYITKHGGTPAKRALADATGLRWQTIHEIAAGRSTPRPDTAKRIEKATGGKVKAAELLGVAKSRAA